MKSINATINCHHSIHLRPAAILIKLRKCFPNTEIQINSVGAVPAKFLRLDSILHLALAEFQDGEKVVVEVAGAQEDLAAEIVRLALENLKDPAQANLEVAAVDFKRVEQHLHTVVDAAFLGMTEQGLGEFADIAIEPQTDEEVQELAYLNDRLHSLTVPVLPAIARHYGCAIELRFEVKSGIQVCKLQPDADELVVNKILAAAPEAGTRITIVVTGQKRRKASESVQSILNNLRQCDEWLRQRKANLAQEDIVKGLLSYARSVAQLSKQAIGNVHSPAISRLLSEEKVIVYLPSSSLTKEEVLHQLVALQSTRYGTLVEEEVLEAVWARERREPVVLRDGLAVPHASVAHGPRIAVSIAIVPKGVEWDRLKPRVKVIVLFIFAEDTHRTYLEHVGQLAAIFKSDPTLQETLVCARNAREVLQILRKAEELILESP